MKRVLFIIIYIIIVSAHTMGQVFSNKIVGKKNEFLGDSIRARPYPYSLPVWGAQAAAKGYDLPYSAGLSVNYFWQQSDLLINNLYVGFNNSQMFNIDEVVRFNNSVSTASAINFRPDIWVFPFLNIYGIFSKAKTSTEINAGLWVPDASNVWREITSFSSKANFDALGIGFGATPTIGVGGGFLALDINMMWTDVSALDKPVFTYVLGPRLGKSFKLKKAERNIALWAGGFRIHLSSSTNGSMLLSDVLPTDGLQTKVDNGLIKVSDTQILVDEWWNGLSSAEQKNPVNIAKHQTADRALQTSANVLNSIDGTLNDDKNATVQYSLLKRPKDMWNFIVGSQFQINKHYMIRAEYGFLGSRQQFMAGLQYRFGL